jgi:hypothetical protein
MGSLGRWRIETMLAWDHQKEAYLRAYRDLLDA